MKHALLVLVIQMGFILTLRGQNDVPSTMKGFDLGYTIVPVDHIRDRGSPRDGSFKSYPFPELEKSEGAISDRFNDHTLKIKYNSENKTAVLLSPDNEKVNATTLFWFAWIAFHPESEIYSSDK